jgi:hypothetical protein
MSQERSQLCHGINCSQAPESDMKRLPSDRKESEIARSQVEPPFPRLFAFILLLLEGVNCNCSRKGKTYQPV